MTTQLYTAEEVLIKKIFSALESMSDSLTLIQYIGVLEYVKHELIAAAEYESEEVEND